MSSTFQKYVGSYQYISKYRYVDAYRSIAFTQDTSDLRGQIKEAGMNTNTGALDLVPGDPNDEMYLRQAEHLMKRGALQAAIIYLHQSLTMNPESKVKLFSLSFSMCESIFVLDT